MIFYYVFYFFLFAFITLLHPCLTQQDFYNNRNTLQFIHLSLKANHYIQDLKSMNQKIWFCFLAYLLISYNRYFQLTWNKMDL